MKTTKKITTFLFIFILSGLTSLFAGCHSFYKGGDVAVKKETRQVGSFTGIQVGGAFEIYITQTGTPSVVVEADEDIIGYIETEVEGGILKIGMKKAPGACLNHVKTMNVYITVADLTSLDLSGAVEVKFENQVKANDLDVEISGAVEADLNLSVVKMEMEMSGACELSLQGTGQDLSIQASGASELNAFDFVVQNLNLYASGANEANVNVTGTLKVKASGACDVRYKGSANVDVYTSGASSVRKED
ncbi:MAG: head GIN domain-containing protein [bacterium]